MKHGARFATELASSECLAPTYNIGDSLSEVGVTIKSCVECGRDFESGKGNTKSCSECRTTYCTECGKLLLTSPWRKRQNRDTYCSRACQFAFNRVRIESNVAYLELTTQAREFVAETVIDLNDLGWLREAGYRWFAKPLPHGQYGVVADAGHGRGNKKRVYLSRLLMEPPAHLKVDHRDGNPLNNCRTNMRIVTQAQNAQNLHGAVRGPIRKPKSGVRNVHWSSKAQKWQVRIGVNYKQIHCGFYETIEEAEAVAIESRRKYMTHSEK